MTYPLGIDVGTGGTRALILDESGTVISSATSDHASFASPQTGWAEQDPDDGWRACRQAVPRALEQAGLQGSDIAAIGLSGQMHGATLLDAAGASPPALIGATNGRKRSATSSPSASARRACIELTSNPALTGFTLPKLLWVRRTEPDAWARVRHVLLPRTTSGYRLTGRMATDVADASGTLLLRRRAPNLVRRDARSHRLAASPAAGSVRGPQVTRVTDGRGAAAVGLLAGTPVVAGGGDQAAGAVGMGIVRAGAVCATLGTSGVVFAATDRPALDPRGRGHTFCHAVPGRWHVMGVTQAAGLSLRWFRDQLRLGRQRWPRPVRRLTDEALARPPGADGVLWAPYLMGERTPHLDARTPARRWSDWRPIAPPRARRSAPSSKASRSACRTRFTILREMHVPVEAIRLGGGGARSALWRQMQADVYGHPVANGGRRGRCRLWRGAPRRRRRRSWPSVDAACDRDRPRHQPKCGGEAAAVMTRQYLAYRALYPALKQLRAVMPHPIAYPRPASA